jgi:hypothetical protein
VDKATFLDADTRELLQRGNALRFLGRVTEPADAVQKADGSRQDWTAQADPVGLAGQA